MYKHHAGLGLPSPPPLQQTLDPDRSEVDEQDHSIPFILWLFYVFETWSHYVTLAGLGLGLQTRLLLNSEIHPPAFASRVLGTGIKSTVLPCPDSNHIL